MANQPLMMERFDTPWQLACMVVGLNPFLPLTFGRFEKAKGRITLADQTIVWFTLHEAIIDPKTRLETIRFLMDVRDSWIGAFTIKGHTAVESSAIYQPICVVPGTVHAAHFRVNAALFWRLERLGHGSMTLESPIEKSEWEQRYAH